jgi:hypothetical protein
MRSSPGASLFCFFGKVLPAIALTGGCHVRRRNGAFCETKCRDARHRTVFAVRSQLANIASRSRPKYAAARCRQGNRLLVRG